LSWLKLLLSESNLTTLLKNKERGRLINRWCK